MRQAMASAIVGDAVIDVDPTVERLEQLTAKILGKQAAVFMPSGSMTNQTAIRVHCERGSEFLCEADCHIYHYEQGAFAGLSGLVAKTIPGDQGVLKREHIEHSINPSNEHSVRSKLLCLENTHNRWGGRLSPQATVIEVTRFARENGLATHLDGARLWNATVASGLSESELCEPFDSVSVCFSKGLGAPVGSALAGSEKYIQEARRARKLFGGAMRQAGIIAAGAFYALENHRDRLIQDHQHAQKLGDAAKSSSAFAIRGNRIDSNMVVVEIDPDYASANEIADRLKHHQVDCFAIGPQAIRLVTHLDVSSQQIDEACRILKTVGSA